MTSTKFHPHTPTPGLTFANQDALPKLPIPPLEDTCKRYLTALRGLQDDEEHVASTRAVQSFLQGDGSALQERLKQWAAGRASYIEDFWYESYLSHSNPVVLALDPFFQLPRAAALIISSLCLIHDLRTGLLDSDFVRGHPLDMDQYMRLFGTARIPTQRGCKMVVNEAACHIVVLRQGQFYWFNVLDEENRPLLTEHEVLQNLLAIVQDADKTPITEVARTAIGVLTTENRKTWSRLRQALAEDQTNAACLSVIDDALFVVCLDAAAPAREGVENQHSHQGNANRERWYDKLQIIICADGAAGINFEHTGVDGHTVLRFVADVYTEGLMLLVRSINPSAPTLFHAPLSPHAKSYKPPKSNPRSHDHVSSISSAPSTLDRYDTSPAKLIWTLTPQIRVGIQFAETRLSDLICQNDCQALEFKGYGKNFITSHRFTPYAFVQMAFQAAYFSLYGRTECTYEPAMTKAFLHGRTEVIRTIQPESIEFTKVSTSISIARSNVSLIEHQTGSTHSRNRHLYALYCLYQHQLSGNLDPYPDDHVPSTTTTKAAVLPSIFADPGWNLLGTSILSTSNCGNPALQLFGFGPVASSKHLQTRRYLDTLQSHLLEVQRILVQLYLSANERSAPFVDHSGILRDSKTGRPINGQSSSDDVKNDGYEDMMTADLNTGGYCASPTLPPQSKSSSMSSSLTTMMFGGRKSPCNSFLCILPTISCKVVIHLTWRAGSEEGASISPVMYSIATVKMPPASLS
ncbi:Choline/Carnitine o-acyltransferase domain containing protein [Tylopilus felleus]